LGWYDVIQNRITGIEFGSFDGQVFLAWNKWDLTSFGLTSYFNYSGIFNFSPIWVKISQNSTYQYTVSISNDNEIWQQLGIASSTEYVNANFICVGAVSTNSNNAPQVTLASYSVSNP
jgi:hypothetical protein